LVAGFLVVVLAVRFVVLFVVPALFTYRLLAGLAAALLRPPP
jgi:hypothetical protein